MANEFEGMEMIAVRDPHTLQIEKMVVHFPGEKTAEENKNLNSALIAAREEIAILKADGAANAVVKRVDTAKWSKEAYSGHEHTDSNLSVRAYLPAGRGRLAR